MLSKPGYINNGKPQKIIFHTTLLLILVSMKSSTVFFIIFAVLAFHGSLSTSEVSSIETLKDVKMLSHHFQQIISKIWRNDMKSVRIHDLRNRVKVIRLITAQVLVYRIQQRIRPFYQEDWCPVWFTKSMCAPRNNFFMWLRQLREWEKKKETRKGKF